MFFECMEEYTPRKIASMYMDRLRQKTDGFSFGEKKEFYSQVYEIFSGDETESGLAEEVRKLLEKEILRLEEDSLVCWGCLRLLNILICVLNQQI